MQNPNKFPEGGHIFFEYQNRDQQLMCVSKFFQDGLDKNEKCIYVVDETTPYHMRRLLHSHGIDVVRHSARGCFDIMTANDFYFSRGYFDPDHTIKLLLMTAKRALKEGYNGIRVTGELSWASKRKELLSKLLAYEKKINVYSPKNSVTALCQYNINLFNPETLDKAMELHPYILECDATVKQNHKFKPPSRIRFPWQ
ncbi:MAG: MEDS domain-containing protein [Elusimicrobiota bacterium]